MPKWKFKLCDCCSNKKKCFKVTCCSCFVAGSLATKLNLDYPVYCWGILLMPCIVGASLRYHIRKSKEIKGNKFNDYLVHCWCSSCCALIQESREMSSEANKIIVSNIPIER